MSGDFLLKLVAEHGPWALLVFFLLWRDWQKDQAIRDVLERNANTLIEIGTIIRERMPRGM